jgi:hypothetical protein
LLLYTPLKSTAIPTPLERYILAHDIIRRVRSLWKKPNLGYAQNTKRKWVFLQHLLTKFLNARSISAASMDVNGVVLRMGDILKLPKKLPRRGLRLGHRFNRACQLKHFARKSFPQCFRRDAQVEIG